MKSDSFGGSVIKASKAVLYFFTPYVFLVQYCIAFNTQGFTERDRAEIKDSIYYTTTRRRRHSTTAEGVNADMTRKEDNVIEAFEYQEERMNEVLCWFVLPCLIWTCCITQIAGVVLTIFNLFSGIYGPSWVLTDVYLQEYFKQLDPKVSVRLVIANIVFLVLSSLCLVLEIVTDTKAKMLSKISEIQLRIFTENRRLHGEDLRYQRQIARPQPAFHRP